MGGTVGTLGVIRGFIRDLLTLRLGVHHRRCATAGSVATCDALMDMLIAHKVDRQRIQCGTVGHRQVHREGRRGCSARHVSVEHASTLGRAVSSVCASPN